MAGRLYRMAKVVSANPASWGIVDANQISGFRTVATQADLYSIAACILSSAYGDGTTTGADAVGQIWHVQDTNKDFRLTSWANRGKAAGWTEELTSESLVGKINAAENKADSAINKANTNTTAITDVKSIANNNALKIKANADSISELKTAVGKKADSSRVDIIVDSVNSNTGDIIDIKSKLAKKADLVNGKLDPEQLPDIDTTLYELAPNNTLPSTLADINKNHIYLVKATTAGTNNVYAEYIYTGTSATYDATKWEKLGEVTASVDLSRYYTKSQVDNLVLGAKPDKIKFRKNPSTVDLQISLLNSSDTGLTTVATIPTVNNTTNGLMSPTMMDKLAGITPGANDYTHPSHTEAGEGLYKITVDNLGHVSKATPVEKADITGLGIPGGIPALTAEVTMTPGTNTIHFVHGDNTPYVVLKTATATEAGLCSTAMFNKLGSLNVVDAPEYDSNDLVTGNGIINAIDTHIIDDANLGSFDASKTGTYTITGLDTGNNNQLTSLTDSLTYTFDPSGNSTLRIDTGAVWTDLTLKAITNDELTEILR